MPITTFNIAAGVDDGVAYRDVGFTPAKGVANSGNFVTINDWMSGGVNGSIRQGYLRFPVTLPAGLTSADVNSASLKIWMSTSVPYAWAGNIAARNSQSPANPNATSSGYKSVFPGYPSYNPTTGPTATFTISNAGTSKTNFNLVNGPTGLDVKTLIGNLVDSYDYSGGSHIMLFVRTPNYLTSFHPRGHLYQKDWDTGGGRVPSLVIDYTAAPAALEPDRTTYRYG